MKKILSILCIAVLSYTANAQLGYRYGVIPGIDNTFSVYPREVKLVAYASTVTVTPTQESTTYDFAQLTGAISIVGKVTYAYTGDRMVCLFHADGSDRVVTFSTGITSAGTLTVPASTYSTVMFVFNGVAWYELSRQNNVSGTVTALLAGNGSVGSPAISFTNDNDCGEYRIGANNTGYAENGAKVLDISTSGLGVVGVITNGAGAAGAPAYSYTGQTNMGRYKISSSQEGQSISGSLVGGWNTSGLFTGTISEQVTGAGIVLAQQTTQERAATTYTTTGTYTVTTGELAKGLLVAATTTATSTMTLPTAASIGLPAGSTFDFYVSNDGASNGTVTVAVNTGIVAASALTGGTTLTLAGSATVGIAGFRLTFISSSVAILSRLL